VLDIRLSGCITVLILLMWKICKNSVQVNLKTSFLFQLPSVPVLAAM
jgi:hypothetical protein